MFKKETLDFLIENRLNDNKQFFIENKERYNEYVLNPLKQLVLELSPYMLEIDSEFITDPKKCVSRIYRDTRFSKDKSIFRDVMWITFQKKKSSLSEGESAFFVEIHPDGFRYGCGYYEAGRDAMEILRNFIDTENKVFLNAFNSYNKQNLFLLEGEKYKKSKYYGENINFSDWYDRKSLSFNKNSEDFNLLFSDKLAETIGKDFYILKDIYKMFEEIELYKKRK